MNKKSILIFYVLLVFCRCAGFAVNIDIGEEFSLQDAAINNSDYSAGKSDHNDFFAHQIRFYLNGELEKNVTVSLKLQLLGIWGAAYGSTQTVVGMTPAVSFHNETPFIENAFIKLDSIQGLPLSFTFGRQPFRLGDGVILDDDGFGFNAYRLDCRWPRKFSWTVIGIKALESSGSQPAGEEDHDAYGAIGEFQPFTGFKCLTYYVREIDKVGPNLKKDFLGLRLEGRQDKGLYSTFYKGEYILQNGTVRYPEEKNNAVGRLFGGGFITDVPMLGKMVVNIDYVLGSGDNSETTETDEAFSPGLGHKRRGLYRAGYGEYYAASLHNVYGGMPAGLSGVQTMSVGVNVSPLTPALTLGGSYYNYKAEKAPANVSNDLGMEIDFSAKYDYSENILLRLIYAVFVPGKGTTNEGDSATKIMLETAAHF